MLAATVRRAAACAVIAAAAAAARCGGSPMRPGDQAPSVLAITPSNGPLSGGTPVQITGSNFAAGATVTIAGAPASDVVVVSSSSITAKTPAGPSTGPADVSVSIAGKAATLHGAFTYQVDPGPPVIDGITAQGARPNEPAGFADVGQPIAIAATVRDPDTPIDQLQFTWTADLGAFSGTGANVTWSAPADSPTPRTVTLSLTVADNIGSATSSVSVSLHNSVKEVGDLAREFLLDFSNSALSPEYVMRNFSTGARCVTPRDKEFADVVKNRTFYRIESYTIGESKVNLQFNSIPCSYRLEEPFGGDACAVVPATWKSLCLVTNPECVAGEHTVADGLDYVTEVYENSRWRLCGSAYGPKSGIRFMR